MGEPIEKASREFVRERTGFTIGGVSPVGAVAPLTTFVERDVLAWDRVWAAAGSHRAVFAATPAELIEATGARVVDVAEG